MIIQVKYLAPFSFVLGKKTSSVSIPDRDSVSVWELLEHIAKHEPRFTEKVVMERNSALNKLSVLAEGSVCDLDTAVPDGANVVLMSPVCGG